MPVSPGSQIASALNKTGLPRTVGGKVRRAILRLIAGGIGLPYVEKTRENLSTLEGRNRIDTLVAEEIARQAIADPAYMERAKARFLGELERKQENVEAVAIAARTKLDEANDADTFTDDDAEPSQDWMNVFVREAECASSEELRQRLASLLAGEARKPGSYSRQTVRLVAEMEHELLVDFQGLLANRFGGVIVREKNWSSGVPLTRAIALEQAGIISGAMGLTNSSSNIGPKGEGLLVGNQYALMLKGKPGDSAKLPIYLLSPSGLELATLLPPIDELQAAKLAAELIDKKILTEITIVRIIKQGDAHTASYREKIWPQAEELGRTTSAN